jgi:hypothetical protein
MEVGMNTISKLVFNVISSRRTIRKYKPDLPNEDSIRRISDIPFFILSDYPIPFQLVILQYNARERAVSILNQTYSVARDIALIGKIVPENLREWWINYIKEFIKTLGGAPIIFVGLTDLKSEKKFYHFKIAWMIAEAIMVQARAENLDTGSFTFASQSIQEEFIGDFLKMDKEKWNIAFALNCGYRDEEPLLKEIKPDAYEIIE